MGGLVCNLIFSSIVTDKTSDSQWRALFAKEEISQSVVNETDSAEKLCQILAKPSFSAADKAWFEQLVASLWKGYS
jgi:hypothetical protein